MKRYKATYITGSTYEFNAENFNEAEYKAKRHTFIKIYKLSIVES